LRNISKERTKIGITIQKGITESLLQIADHIHSRGVVHRDIKPNNIIINEKNQIFLVDFNLAKLIDSEEKEESKFRLGYSSPK